jgi:methionyl-tRNA formyltransferase
MSPYPGAWFVLEEQKMIVYEALIETCNHTLKPGMIVTDNKKILKIAVLDGFIHLVDIKLQGKKRMGIKSFLNGYSIKNQP